LISAARSARRAVVFWVVSPWVFVVDTLSVGARAGPLPGIVTRGRAQSSLRPQGGM